MSSDSDRASKKQRELLNFVDGFIKGNGYGPSYREIMRALGYKSVSTVAVHIDGLIAKGFLIKRDHSARSLEVVSTDTRPTPPLPNSDNNTRQQLLDKISELAGSSEAEARRDVQTLIESLRILGFDKDYRSAQQQYRGEGQESD